MTAGIPEDPPEGGHALSGRAVFPRHSHAWLVAPSSPECAHNGHPRRRVGHFLDEPEALLSGPPPMGSTRPHMLASTPTAVSRD